MDSELPEEYLDGTYIPLDCQYIVALPTEKGAVIFTEVYHIGRKHRLQKLNLGEWDPQRGPSWTNVSFYTRRRDLHGVKIKAAVIADVSMISVGPVFHGKHLPLRSWEKDSCFCDRCKDTVNCTHTHTHI
jgi:hypothetical protein